jgi:hypothetical protein
MDGKKPTKSEERARLRREFMQRASAAFERMFGASETDQLVTFTQREDRACALGQELSGWLLEQHAAVDPSVRPAEGAVPHCPKCGRPGKRVAAADTPLPERQLTTAAGEVTLRREQWRCATCRVAFFPSGPQTATGDGRL